MSSNCKYCHFLQSSTAISDNSNFTEGAAYPAEKEKCNCEFQRGFLVFRGRLGIDCNNSWFNRGKRASVCKHCLCKLSDLKKGQTPAPLTKYCNYTPANTQLETRTFEKLKNDNEKYRNDGQPKQKVKDYNNFEFPTLFEGTGPILYTTSCMTLHISLGVGLNILNIIEEAIKLDNEIENNRRNEKFAK